MESECPGCRQRDERIAQLERQLAEHAARLRELVWAFVASAWPLIQEDPAVSRWAGEFLTHYRVQEPAEVAG